MTNETQAYVRSYIGKGVSTSNGGTIALGGARR